MPTDRDTAAFRPRRSLLFVPASRPDRFEKAVRSGADMVCIDLEDAVPPSGKDGARDAVGAYLSGRSQAEGGAETGVRLNSVHTLDGCRDVLALAPVLAQADFVMVPKVSCRHDLDLIVDWLGAGIGLVPVIESARGLENAADILRQPNCIAGLFGGADYSADVGVTLDWDPLMFARARLANAAAGAGVLMIDVPYLDIADEAGLAAETRRVRALGLHARAAIHPKQIAAIHDAFRPDTEEVAQARRVVAAFESGDGGAALLDGKLIERPVILAARRTLVLADAT